MKSFTDLFIRRPVLAVVVNLVILIAGLQAVRTLTVRQYPRSDNASITVTTVYVGASADLVRGFITTPLERTIAAADGIDYIESSSKLGLSTIHWTLSKRCALRWPSSGRNCPTYRRWSAATL
jgi:multidrug efflux pump